MASVPAPSSNGSDLLRRAGAIASTWCVVVLVAGCRTAGPVDTTPSAGQGVITPNATVERVVDGDTIDVEIDGHRERVRLIGIDTPETVDPDRPVQCYGPEASAHTKELLGEGTMVMLVLDAESRDDYGRLLAYVYRAPDGLFVNLDLVATGHARPLTIEPNDAFAPAFVAAAREAESADIGLWGTCSG